MRRIYVHVILSFIALLTGITCSDDPVTAKSTGSLEIISEPGGADIFINDNMTGVETPAVVANIDTGVVKIRLSVPGFIDTTFFASVTAGYQRIIEVKLSPSPQPPDTVHFKGIKIYEQSVVYEHGLDLSAGQLVDAVSPEADIFFEGRGGFMDLRSQHLKDVFTTNNTFFLNTDRTDLYDGEDAPSINSTSGSWVFSNENNNNSSYSFLYDKNRNYSKLKIISTGIDNPFQRWVIVEYIYNKTPRDVRF